MWHIRGGSAATLDAFVAAREAAGNPERPTVYMSDQSHSAQIRALMSSTMVGRTFSLRLCIINHNTTWTDVRETIENIERYGSEELSK